MLTLQHLTKHYGALAALQDVSLSLEKGKIHGLLGPNGSGKTTLLRLLCQLLTPDSGEVRYDGHPLTREDVCRHIGYLPEERGLYRNMSPLQQVTYFGRLHGFTARESERRARQWLQRLDLGEKATTPLSALSKGQAQRAQIAVALIHEPSVLVFDEPFSGFDPLSQQQLAQLLTEYLHTHQAALFLSTHDLHTAQQLVHDVTILYHGRAVVQGALASLLAPEKNTTFQITPLHGDPFLYTLPPDKSLHDAIAALNDQYTLLAFQPVTPSLQDLFLHTLDTTSR